MARRRRRTGRRRCVRRRTGGISAARSAGASGGCTVAFHIGPAALRRTGRPASAPRGAPSVRRSPAHTGRSLIPSKSIIGKRRAISPGQHLGRQAELPVRGDAVVKVRLLGREEEQDAARRRSAAPKRRSAPSTAAAIPSPSACRSRPCRRRRGSGGTPRRRRSGCARSPGVDQRHLVAAVEQMMRGPRAEHARADDRNMSSSLISRTAAVRAAEHRRRPETAVVGEEAVRDDLRLLLEAVAVERLSRLQLIGVAAEGVAHQRQIEAPLCLRLPDVGHLVDEEALARRAAPSRNPPTSRRRRGGTRCRPSAPSRRCADGTATICP